eukprot:CAMPEP_0119291846 /NCGR_PEP_ID=MMETSP1329-20130426/43127_1 /TAXON_ID=114041 /ORGANISM="Genus nov. species nov., Strain RCC1024" /LENGTH=72 /DNA_ID=CAMNT_0007292675 /DNA_START=97 /DNA_END=311 /DNA_ORIENTATION=+
MEAFAVVGLDIGAAADMSSIDEAEWSQCIVDVAVVAGDAAVRAPWERCEGLTNDALGLRKAGLAVRRVGTEA